MPRGVYDRAAAAARRAAPVTEQEGVASVSAPQPSVAPRSRGVQRDADWANRSRNIKGHVDYFDMVKHEVPPDASYEWKRYSLWGKEETQSLVIYQENGWTPVPADRHPALPKVGDCIIHEGMILMERPKHLTQEARAEDRVAASEAMRMNVQKVGETPSGQMDRRVLNVNVSKGPMTIDG